MKAIEREVVIDSDTAQGQRVQADILAAARNHGFVDPDLSAIRLAIEEALVNAIQHGNGSSPSKKVWIQYQVGGERIRVRIQDEGPGFDPNAVPDPTDPEYLERPCGRGLTLIRYYMSEVLFNDCGNCIEFERLKGYKPEEDPRKKIAQ